MAWQSSLKRGQTVSDSDSVASAGLQYLTLYLIYHAELSPILRSALSVSTHYPSFFVLFCRAVKRLPGPVTRQRGKAGIISTAFHYYDNTFWSLKAIETLRETGDFKPPG